LFVFDQKMRFFLAIAACVLLSVSTALAASSVKLPKGFVVPENTVLDGRTLYYSIANSLNTLPRSADISKLATSSECVSSIVGKNGKQRASIVIVPESFASGDFIGAVADNDFPLNEMSRTFSSALVMPGASNTLKNAFARRSFRSIYAPRDIKSSVLSLDKCGVKLDENTDDNSFVFNQVTFEYRDYSDVVSAAAALCSANLNEQVTVIDFRTAHKIAVEGYGSDSAQVAAIKNAVNSAIYFLEQDSFVFVLATDSNFYENQVIPGKDFQAVSPKNSVDLRTSREALETNSDTGAFQITLWFTITVSLVIGIFTLLTCGVGIDIEKDTLLYQTTCLRGQPVF